MIVFDLRCGSAHVFEVWFRSSADYQDQRDRGLIVCPVCGDSGIEKAVMAPNVGAKGNRDVIVAPPAALSATASTDQAQPSLPVPSAAAIKQALAVLAAQQAAMLEKSVWVGDDFANRARSMHLGDEPASLIHGQASIAEARDLIDEGVAIAPLLVPVIPPDARN